MVLQQLTVRPEPVPEQYHVALPPHDPPTKLLGEPLTHTLLVVLQIPSLEQSELALLQVGEFAPPFGLGQTHWRVVPQAVWPLSLIAAAAVVQHRRARAPA